MIEEIRIFLECGGGSMGGNHLFVCFQFGGRVFDIATAFFLSFIATGLGTDADLGLAVFLVAVTLGCLGDSVAGSCEGFGFRGRLVKAFTTRHSRTTRFHHSPTSIYSAEGPAR